MDADLKAALAELKRAQEPDAPPAEDAQGKGKARAVKAKAKPKVKAKPKPKVDLAEQLGLPLDAQALTLIGPEGPGGRKLVYALDSPEPIGELQPQYHWENFGWAVACRLHRQCRRGRRIFSGQ